MEEKKKKKRANHTPRTIKSLRNRGFIAQNVERWCAYSRRHHDLFGCIDIVAVHPMISGVMGVQVTSKSNVASRRKKAMETPELETWLRAGNRFSIYGWYKEKNRWKVAVEEISIE